MLINDITSSLMISNTEVIFMKHKGEAFDVVQDVSSEGYRKQLNRISKVFYDIIG